jgi:CheY-like chemotaxis protein
MANVFLFMEDPVELAAFEGLLRKLGLDVTAVSRAARAIEVALASGASLAILPGRGESVGGESVGGEAMARSLRQIGFRGAIAVTWPHEESVPSDALADAGIDGVIAHPVEPLPAISTIAELLGQDPAKFFRLYEKLQSSRLSPSVGATAMSSGLVHVKGVSEKATTKHVKSSAAPDTSPVKEARTARNDRFLATVSGDKPGPIASREKLRASEAELREDSRASKAALDELDASKRDFTKALFQVAKKTPKRS